MTDALEMSDLSAVTDALEKKAWSRNGCKEVAGGTIRVCGCSSLLQHIPDSEAGGWVGGRAGRTTGRQENGALRETRVIWGRSQTACGGSLEVLKARNWWQRDMAWSLETGDWRGTWVQTTHWNRL